MAYEHPVLDALDWDYPDPDIDEGLRCQVTKGSLQCFLQFGHEGECMIHPSCG